MCNHNDASRTPVTARNSPSPHACVFASSCMAELTLEAMVRDGGKPLPGVLKDFDLMRRAVGNEGKLAVAAASKAANHNPYPNCRYVR